MTSLYDRAKADPGAAAELRCFLELENEEGAAFSALLAVTPTIKAGAVACVQHVSECGLASNEMRAWLAMLIASPLAS